MLAYVIGLGHVGFPTAVWLSQSGYRVIGLEKDGEVREKIEKGEIHVYEKFAGRLLGELGAELIREGRLEIKESLKERKEEGAPFLLTVGMEIPPEGYPDIAPLLEVIDQIGPKLLGDDLIIIRSTLVPGTTEKYILPRIWHYNAQVKVAYCPETVQEGGAVEELNENPLILAGICDESYDRARKFFRDLFSGPIKKVSDIRTAEMVKVVQNIYRDVNIALSNELESFLSALGLNTREIIDRANFHPRVFLHDPGPGVGGHCIPRALDYFKAAMQEGMGSSLLQKAREINIRRPEDIGREVWEVLQARSGREKFRVAVYGLAMKGECADLRQSPALDLIRFLQQRGAEVRAYDPLIKMDTPFYRENFSEAIENADILIITAAQPDLKSCLHLLRKFPGGPRIIFDTRNSIVPEEFSSEFEVIIK